MLFDVKSEEARLQKLIEEKDELKKIQLRSNNESHVLKLARERERRLCSCLHFCIDCLDLPPSSLTMLAAVAHEGGAMVGAECYGCGSDGSTVVAAVIESMQKKLSEVEAHAKEMEATAAAEASEARKIAPVNRRGRQFRLNNSRMAGHPQPLQASATSDMASSARVEASKIAHEMANLKGTSKLESVKQAIGVGFATAKAAQAKAQLDKTEAEAELETYIRAQLCVEVSRLEQLPREIEEEAARQRDEERLQKVAAAESNLCEAQQAAEALGITCHGSPAAKGASDLDLGFGDCKLCFESYDQSSRHRVALGCGHQLCSSCLEQVTSQRSRSESCCPTCRTPITSSIRLFD